MENGEGSSMVCYKLQNDDKVLIVEDVIIAGVVIRAVFPIFKAEGTIISIDCMERGEGDKMAIQEIEKEFGIKIYSSAAVREIIDVIHNVETDEKVYIDDEMKVKMEKCITEYCEI